MKNISPAFRFAILFVGFYLVFNLFFNFWIGICSPGGLYWSFAAEHLDFIRAYRHFLLAGSSLICEAFGLRYLTNDISLLIVGRGGIKIVYSCLGYGIISLLWALTIAVPGKKLKQRLCFALLSALSFSLLNMVRLFVVAYYARSARSLGVDHHLIFNFICYLLILIALYFWMRKRLFSSSNAQ